MSLMEFLTGWLHLHHHPDIDTSLTNTSKTIIRNVLKGCQWVCVEDDVVNFGVCCAGEGESQWNFCYFWAKAPLPPPSTQVKTALRDLKGQAARQVYICWTFFRKAEVLQMKEKEGRKGCSAIQLHKGSMSLHSRRRFFVTVQKWEIERACVHTEEPWRRFLWNSPEQFPPGAHARCFSPLCLIRQVLLVNTGDYGAGEGNNGGSEWGTWPKKMRIQIFAHCTYNSNTSEIAVTNTNIL